MSSPTPPLPTRSNPFASRFVRPGAFAFRFDHVSSTHEEGSREDFVRSLVDRLREERCGVIVGDHGTGKSTLLRELAETLEREMPGGQWVQLTGPDPASTRNERIVRGLGDLWNNIRTVGRLQRSVPRGGVLVIDGGEQIPAFWRWWIAHRAKRRDHFCLLTSHSDVAGFATLYRTHLSPDLIGDLVRELLSGTDAALQPGARIKVQQHLDTIDLSRVGNLRDLWDDLYEIVQS
ncbi:energy-coupling factor transporter ATP-binding protein EcfA2 [Rhodopirellula rubra]|uniref:Energy-coupling factor transporter ATP-binding protein EcfA2 n=1 Tax=Aporhodopirellula rubra TaxID=980271 RepID=A0A7W5H4A2_9BACT|nr:ATP-binding protein [Aporhodopirellula rubra]MBB3204621.1 energy-coupling factor transporter ATP-binding protein EcfA2 [Aporhodopirellula rubra]